VIRRAVNQSHRTPQSTVDPQEADALSSSKVVDYPTANSFHRDAVGRKDKDAGVPWQRRSLALKVEVRSNPQGLLGHDNVQSEPEKITDNRLIPRSRNSGSSHSGTRLATASATLPSAMVWCQEFRCGGMLYRAPRCQGEAGWGDG
jgi:hypothetical protein